MTSNQTTPDQGEEPEVGDAEATEYKYEYTLPGADRAIGLRKPSDAQMAVLLRLESMLEDSPVAGVQLYMDSLGALMSDADEQWCMRALLRGKVQLDDFADIGRQTLFFYYPELKKAAEDREKTSRQHGPTATRRPRRR